MPLEMLMGSAPMRTFLALRSTEQALVSETSPDYCYGVEPGRFAFKVVGKCSQMEEAGSSSGQIHSPLQEVHVDHIQHRVLIRRKRKPRVGKG